MQELGKWNGGPPPMREPATKPGRESRTDADIKRAFLELLHDKSMNDISVSELARAAKVSRSTFYLHYRGIFDVYESLVEDFREETSPIVPQLECAGGEACGQRRPFCELVRGSGRLQPIVNEEHFLPTFLSNTEMMADHDLYRLLVDAGYTDAQARAVCTFQMSGCFSAAHEGRCGESAWPEIRKVIDMFIRGGVEACLNAKKGE